MEFLVSAQTIKPNFILELKKAASGETTSIRFIKHQLPSQKKVRDNGLFQVQVIGGSVFQKALVKKEHDKITILKSHTETLPLLTTKEIFLSYLARHFYLETDILAVNFAYPLNPVMRNKNFDGILLSGSKENQFQGLIGQKVGEAIEHYIGVKYQRTVTVSLTNDVICLLLSGIDTYPKEYLVGAIMGSGTNMTFFYENNVINLESGNFNKFTPSAECLEIDKGSKRPGTQLFEKETAGAYLYKHFNISIKKRGLSHPPLYSTKELYNIVLNDKGTEAQMIAFSLFERSAAYFAAQLAGLTAFKNYAMTFIMEGSMYWENPLYQNFLSEYLQKLSPDYKIMIVKVEESPIMGGAKLVA